MPSLQSSCLPPCFYHTLHMAPTTTSNDNFWSRTSAHTGLLKSRLEPLKAVHGPDQSIGKETESKFLETFDITIATKHTVGVPFLTKVVYGKSGVCTLTTQANQGTAQPGSFSFSSCCQGLWSSLASCVNLTSTNHHSVF